MLPALILVDIAVLLFYLKKGIASAKIKAHIDIIKNWNKVRDRYNQIQNVRTYDDKEIIKIFADDLLVPRWVVDNTSNQLFNGFIKMLSRIFRRFI